MAEIQIPFHLDVHGNVATTSDPGVQQMQHVASLVKTYPGERVMRPNYGIPLRDYVFASGTDFVSHEINKEVTSQMSKWEPSIQVTNIEPVLDEASQGVVSLNVTFNGPGGNVTGVKNTAVVYVGGKVIES